MAAPAPSPVGCQRRKQPQRSVLNPFKKMVGCGHQLGCSDNSGWLMSSSAAAPVGGSSNTSHILHKIMADELYEAPSRRPITSTHTDFLQSKRIELLTAKEREAKLLRLREGRIAERRSRVDSYHDFSDFDETEHNDGCPVKWLYRRQSTESWRSTGSRERDKNLREKAPREIQIKKMGLKKRNHPGSKKKNPQRLQRTADSIEEDWNEEEDYHCGFENCYSDTDEYSTMQNYLIPRPLTGTKQWLYIYLSPKQERNRFSPVPQKSTARTEVTISDSPRISVQSITFPDIEKSLQKPQVTPKTRWAKRIKKPSRAQHTYRTPALLDIKLREKIAKEIKTEKVEAVQEFEEVVPFIEEDRLYRLKRFFNIEPKLVHEEKLVQSEEVNGKDVVVKKSRKLSKSCSYKDSMLLISSKAKFSERPGKPMR